MPVSYPDTLHLDDSQGFVCTSCGLCCSRPWGVRIEPEVESGIRNSRAVERLQKKGYVPLQLDPERSLLQAARQDSGACIFLEEENLCSLHRELGGQGKPLGCQTYPYRAVRTPSGTYVSLSWVCPPVVAGLDRNVEENRHHLQQLLARHPQAAAQVPDMELPVRITPTRSISWVGYLRLEQRLLEGLDLSHPGESLLTIALELLQSAHSLEQEPPEWPKMGVLPDDTSFEKALLTLYLRGAISVVETCDDPARRDLVGQALAGERVLASLHFPGNLPTLEPDAVHNRTLQEAFSRYYRNMVVGKALLRPTLVSRLLTLAVAYPMLDFYSRAIESLSGDQDPSLASLTKAFEIVESELFHSGTIDPLFSDFESTLSEIVAPPAE